MIRQLAIDVIGVAGLVLIGYGLHQYQPWISYTVVGALMIAFACRASKQ